MFANLVAALVEHERIETTEARAKEVRRIAEKAITLGKKGTVHARRLVMSRLRQAEVVRKLFSELADRFRERPGGYCRIYKYRRRLGDGAPMAILELLGAAEKGAPGGRVAAAAGETGPVTTKETFDGQGGGSGENG